MTRYTVAADGCIDQSAGTLRDARRLASRTAGRCPVGTTATVYRDGLPVCTVRRVSARRVSWGERSGRFPVGLGGVS